MSDADDAAMGNDADKSILDDLKALIAEDGDASGGATAPAEAVQAMDVELASTSAHPHANGGRAPLEDLLYDAFEGRSMRSAKVPAQDAGLPASARVEPQPAPTAAALKERAVRMFVDRHGGLVESGAGALAIVPTYELVLHAQQAVHELWEQRRADICGSPERPDLQMDKEEGLGYLLGDVLRGQLLPEEARAIGKRAGKLASKAKGELETAKAKAATKRSKRRAAAINCSEPGIGLDEACAAIDAEAADIRSAILATACELGLPAAESVVAEARPQTVARRAAAADSKLRKLRKDEIEVRQALELADAHRVGARRDLEKCRAAQDKVLAQMRAWQKARLFSNDESLVEREWEEWVRIREKAESNSRMASEHCKACEEDYFAAEEAAEVALHALECAESERARERQEEARVPEREVRNREWEVAAAGRAAGRAAAAADRDMELAELDSRIVAALNRARAVCCDWAIISGVK